MNKIFNKIRISLITLWIVIISFPSKVLGIVTRYIEGVQVKDVQTLHREDLYGVPSPFGSTTSIVDTIIKIFSGVLIVTIFVVGIINFIKIRKIEDKSEKNKKIKKAVIVIAILLVILIATFVISTLLLGK